MGVFWKPLTFLLRSGDYNFYQKIHHLQTMQPNTFDFKILLEVLDLKQSNSLTKILDFEATSLICLWENLVQTLSHRSSCHLKPSTKVNVSIKIQLKICDSLVSIFI